MQEHTVTNLSELTIVIKGAGEMASAVAWRLYMANFKKILMLDVATPLAVRRKVSFCEALHDESQTVEGVKAIWQVPSEAFTRHGSRGE